MFEKCSSSFTLREIQIKPSVRFYLTSVRMAITKKEQRKKHNPITNSSEDVQKRDAVSGNAKLCNTVETSISQVLKKLKLGQVQDPGRPLS